MIPSQAPVSSFLANRWSSLSLQSFSAVIILPNTNCAHLIGGRRNLYRMQLGTGRHFHCKKKLGSRNNPESIDSFPVYPLNIWKVNLKSG